MTNTITTTPTPTAATTGVPHDPKQAAKVRRVLETRSFATLATTSPKGRPHVAGVLYDLADGDLWIHTTRSSRKARSITENPHVAVCVPFRKLPAGPPYTLHFQARAELIAMDERAVTDLLEAGELKHISGHGALEMSDGVFVRIEPGEIVHSYGLGENPIDLIRDPLNTGARSTRLTGAVAS